MEDKISPVSPGDIVTPALKKRHYKRQENNPGNQFELRPNADRWAGQKLAQKKIQSLIDHT